jgi:Flp pilus assembly pilin Flp
MVEYALLVTLMSIGCMGAVRLMKISVEESFVHVKEGLACTGFYNPETGVCTPS